MPKVHPPWPSVSGALRYDIYRGDLSDLVDTDDDGLPDNGYGICMSALDDDVRDTHFVDTEIPTPAGSGFFYLRSVINAQGDSGLGTNSAGQAYVELVYTEAMSKPEIRDLMGNVDQLTGVLVQIPELVTSEREAVMGELLDGAAALTHEIVDTTMGRVSDERQKAVNQIFDRIATERQTTLDVLLSAEEPVRGVLADMNRTVAAANELTNSVNALASRGCTSQA